MYITVTMSFTVTMPFTYFWLFLLTMSNRYRKPDSIKLIYIFKQSTKLIIVKHVCNSVGVICVLSYVTGQIKSDDAGIERENEREQATRHWWTEISDFRIRFPKKTPAAYWPIANRTSPDCAHPSGCVTCALRSGEGRMGRCPEAGGKRRRTDSKAPRRLQIAIVLEQLILEKQILFFFISNIRLPRQRVMRFLPPSPL